MGDATNHPMTEAERLAVAGLVAREAALRSGPLAELAADYAALFAEVEARLGLEPGAIGSSHRIDLDARLVGPMPGEEDDDD